MIFVTGGTGITGSRLLFRLTASGHDVLALKRPGSDLTLTQFVFRNSRDLLKKINWIDGDITDPLVLDDCIKKDDQVYHAAGLVSFASSDRDELYRVNINGTENIVNACLRANAAKLVHLSSVAALGRSDDIYIDENSHWDSSVHASDYAISKYGGEREVWRGIAEGLNAVIVNPSIIISAGLSKHGSAGLIDKVYNGLRFYTGGVSGFTGADDVARAMIMLMQSELRAERFLISAENLAYSDLFSMMASAFNKRPPDIKAGKWLATVYMTAETVKSKLTGTRPLVTKSSVASAFSKYYYSGNKITEKIPFSYTPLNKVIEDACREYLELKGYRKK